jgi:hypothetical protein
VTRPDTPATTRWPRPPHRRTRQRIHRAAALLALLACPLAAASVGGSRRGERAQSTVEYALLLLGAAAIALVVVAWVTRTDLIGRLFDTVVGRILQQA